MVAKDGYVLGITEAVQWLLRYFERGSFHVRTVVVEEEDSALCQWCYSGVASNDHQPSGGGTSSLTCAT